MRIQNLIHIKLYLIAYWRRIYGSLASSYLFLLELNIASIYLSVTVTIVVTLSYLQILLILQIRKFVRMAEWMFVLFHNETGELDRMRLDT